MCAALVSGLWEGGLFAKVLVAPDVAVREAFPGATTVQRTDYLSEAQASRIESLAGTPPSSRIVISWRAQKAGAPVGTAYLETHVVRTVSESILVVIDTHGSVQKVEILTFDEPEEYLPRTKWLEQFRGRSLDADLSLKGGVRGITGATLSSRAITSAVRRVLAAHAVLSESPAPDPAAPAPSVPAGSSVSPPRPASPDPAGVGGPQTPPPHPAPAPPGGTPPATPKDGSASRTIAAPLPNPEPETAAADQFLRKRLASNRGIKESTLEPGGITFGASWRQFCPRTGESIPS